MNKEIKLLATCNLEGVNFRKYYTTDRMFGIYIFPSLREKEPTSRHEVTVKLTLDMIKGVPVHILIDERVLFVKSLDNIHDEIVSKITITEDELKFGDITFPYEISSGGNVITIKFGAYDTIFSMVEGMCIAHDTKVARNAKKS